MWSLNTKVRLRKLIGSVVYYPQWNIPPLSEGLRLQNENECQNRHTFGGNTTKEILLIGKTRASFQVSAYEIIMAASKIAMRKSLKQQVTT